MVCKDVKIDLDELREYLAGDNIAVVTDTAVYGYYERIFPSGTIVLPRGEKAKTFDGLRQIIECLHERGMGGDSKIIAVGGGAIGDVAGLAASVYHRGVRWEVVPTTLLAVSDSSVGGKTAINISSCKNVIGTFYTPSRRLLCREFINTLDEGELKSGFGEIIKTSLLDKDLFRNIYEGREISFDDRDLLYSLALASSEVKKRIVKEDFSDKGVRRSLNIGHTVGHAVEAAFGLPHGVAVVFGIAAECKMFEEYIERDFAKKVGEICDAYFGRHFSVAEKKELSEIKERLTAACGEALDNIKTSDCAASPDDKHLTAACGEALDNIKTNDCAASPTGKKHCNRCKILDYLRRDKKNLRGITSVIPTDAGEYRLITVSEKDFVARLAAALKAHR